jgi:glycosyltransferase involved in cell wall biosynthesis
MLTGIVLTKNEERNIKACLKSLSFCDEILVIDDFSTDQTVKIAKKANCQVLKRKLGNSFAAQRNFALKKAKPGWVLFVDADERVTPDLQEEIKTAIKNPEIIGYFLKRRDILFGKKIHFGETRKTRLLRLARRDGGEWTRRVHETWQVKGRLGQLKTPLLHYPHQSLTDFLKEINHYSSLHAQTLYEERKQTNLFEIIFYPLAKFLKNYFFHLGFLDTMPGLILALTMSLHSFLARGKLFMLTKKGPVEYNR